MLAVIITIMVASALAWLVVQRTIVESGSELDKLLGGDIKGKISPVLYIMGICLAWVKPWLGDVCYAIVALMWIVPDRRIEEHLAANDES